MTLIEQQYIGSGTGEILPVLINPTHEYYFYVIKRDNLIDYDGENYSELKIIDYNDGRNCLLKQKIYENIPSPQQFWDENKTDPAITAKIGYYSDYLIG